MTNKSELIKAVEYLQNVDNAMQDDEYLQYDNYLKKVCDYVRQHEAKGVDDYHRVMNLLQQAKGEHGLCNPRTRKACTSCNATEQLDAMLADYKGAPIVRSTTQPVGDDV